MSAAKKVRINLLYDFYGQLLTAKQRALFVLYYQADLSLGEIAEQQDVSRQAVYDILKRSERTLENLEAKLNLVEKHIREQYVINELEHELDAVRVELLRLAAGREQSAATVAADEANAAAAHIEAAAKRVETVVERLRALD